MERGLIEIAQDEVVFVQAQEVTEFMEVSGADFLGKDLRISFGQIPKVSDVKDDTGRRIGRNGVGLQTIGAFKEAQQVGPKTLIQNCWVWNILVEGEKRFRGGA